MQSENLAQILLPDGSSPSQLVGFDWDLTLADNSGLVRESLNRAFEGHGFEFVAGEKCFDDNVVTQLVRTHLPDVEEDIVRAVKLSAREHYRNILFQEDIKDLLELRPDAERLLGAYGNKGVFRFVVSNKDRPRLEREIELLGVREHFKAVQGSSYLTQYKPHPEIYEMALDGMGFPSSLSAVYFGDSSSDVGVAENTGASSIILDVPGHNDDLINKIKAGDVGSPSNMAIIDGFDQAAEVIEVSKTRPSLHAFANQRFQRRSAKDIPVTTGLNYSTLRYENPELFIKLHGAKKRKIRDDIATYIAGDVDEYISRDMAGQEIPFEVAQQWAEECAEALISNEMLESVAVSVLKTFSERPNGFQSIKLLFPTPFDQASSKNLLPAAMSEVIYRRLPEFLDNSLSHLDIVCDSETPENTVVNLTANNKGKGFNPEDPSELKLDFIGKISRQAVFAGSVDEGAIYIPIDDGAVSLATMSNLINHIMDQGGTIAHAITGYHISPSKDAEFKAGPIAITTIKQLIRDKARADVTKNYKDRASEAPEKIEFLEDEFENELVLRTKNIEGGLEKAFEQIGLCVGLEDSDKSTLTNVEALILVAYFSNPRNPQHADAFDRLLTRQNLKFVDLRGTYIDNVFNAPVGTLRDLIDLFDDALEKRTMLGPLSEDVDVSNTNLKLPSLVAAYS